MNFLSRLFLYCKSDIELGQINFFDLQNIEPSLFLFFEPDTKLSKEDFLNSKFEAEGKIEKLKITTYSKLCF